MYLIIILASPVYFLTRKKWGGFILNSLLYSLAWINVLVLGIFGGLGFISGGFFWLLAVAHAGWYLRKEMIQEHAEIIAAKMAERLKGNQKK